MAVTSDGSTLYLAAFGSSVVGIFDTTELESDTFTPSAADHSSGSPIMAPTGRRLSAGRPRPKK